MSLELAPRLPAVIAVVAVEVVEIMQNLFLLGCAFMAVIWAEGLRADILGLPSDPGFPKAHFPYAHDISGCSELIGGVAPRLVIPSDEGPKQVSFDRSCRDYNRCLQAINGSFGSCNQGFEEALRQACRRDLKLANLLREDLTEVDQTILTNCYRKANRIFAQVQGSDPLGRYESARRTTRAYFGFLMGWIADHFSEKLNRNISRLEVFWVVGELRQGLTIGELIRQFQEDRVFITKDDVEAVDIDR